MLANKNEKCHLSNSHSFSSFDHIEHIHIAYALTQVIGNTTTKLIDEDCPREMRISFRALAISKKCNACCKMLYT